MVAITLIEYYQQVISPRKGFYCPHRLLHGRASCSEHGKRIIGRFGLHRGLLLLERRLVECRQAGLLLQQNTGAGGPVPAGGVKGFWANTCDTIGCGFDGLSCIGEAISCFG